MFREKLAVCVADSIGETMSMHYSCDKEADTRDNYGSIQKMAAGTYRRTVNMGRRTKLWNTEFGGQFDFWDENLTDEMGGHPGGAWKLATDYMLCLMYDFTGVIYWQGCEGMGNNAATRHYTLIQTNNGQYVVGPRFYVAKQIYRYVRPGAIKVGCTSSSEADIWSVAYRHKEQQTYTILLMNRSSSAQTVTVQGAGLPQSMDVYQTSPNQNCAKVGTVAPGGTVSLPVKSLTTICNAPSVGVAARHVRGNAHSAGGTMHAADLYRIDGRTVCTASGASARLSLDTRYLHAGRYLVRTRVAGTTLVIPLALVR